MTVRDRATLKTYFETGETPSQAQFHDWFDSIIVTPDDLGTDVLTALAEDTNAANGLVQLDVAGALPALDGSALTVKVYFGFKAVGESTDLTVGQLASFRLPFAMTLTDIRAAVNTAPTGADAIFDVREGGTTVLGTLITVEATELTSVDAATQPTITDGSLADNAVISIHCTQIGSATAGAGLEISFIGTRAG